MKSRNSSVCEVNVRNEIEKGKEDFIYHLGSNAVISEVAGWDFAVAISEEAGHWRCAVEGKRLFEDCHMCKNSL